jgi:VanZ family protein
MDRGLPRSHHRSSATWLALAWALLIAYASLYPLTGWRWPPGQDLATLIVLPWPPWRDDFDRWANLAGYLPLGALLLVAARRSGWRAAPALLLALAVPAALSYGVEVLQQFLPGRHPSLKDWALNLGGAACGVALALVGRALGLDERWHRWRLRWFAGESAGALALLVLWPAALLFPAPAPLALGQLAPWLQDTAAALAEGVPWLEELPALAPLLSAPAPAVQAMPAATELAVTALGLLAPCLLAYAVIAPGLRRIGALAVLALLAAAAMTLSTLLNFGPRHALAWIGPLTPAALATAALAAAVLAPAGRRLSAVLGLMALTGGVSLVAQVPADPFYAQKLAIWDQGVFVRFHGLARWLAWLWPFAAMGWLLARVVRGEGPRPRR